LTVTRRLPAYAALATLLLCLMPVAGVVAYLGQNPYAVQLKASDKEASCADEVTITATVRSSETGALIAGQTVNWDFKVSVSDDDELSAQRTVTNENGKTKVTVSFGPVEGSRTVRATIASWPATIKISCQGGLPTPAPTPQATPKPTPQATPKPNATPTASHPSVNPPSASPTPSPSATPTTPPTTTPGQTATPSPEVTPTPSLAPSATDAPTSPPTAPATSAPTVTPAATPDATALPADPDTTLTAGLAPVLFIVLVVAGLGGLLVFARRR
jgi:hypothetical protein